MVGPLRKRPALWPMILTRLLGLALSIVPALPPARAYEIDEAPGYLHPEDSIPSLSPIPDHGSPASEAGVSIPTRLRKLNLALKALGIPEERAPDFIDFPSPASISQEAFESNLPMLDPDGALRRYLRLESNQLSLFRDFFSPGVSESLLEFFFPFQSKTPAADSAPLIERLRRIGTQVRQDLYEFPLSGLRVLIDPGHMGNEEWDHLTGKFVTVGGKTVSEGAIALSTSLLLATELENLGAEVTLTRETNGPVARTTLDSFDPTPHVNQYFYNGLDSWMSAFFQLDDARFVTEVKNAPETARAFSASQRAQYFISGEDLEARSRIMDEVRADLVIAVHYDASRSNELQNGDRSIEAFVPGGIRQSETGSRVSRGQHLKHLLEVRRWNESVSLASSMMGSMSESLGLPLLNRPEFLTSVKVKDGVYARNLYLNRRNLHSLMVYLECLHYDHVREFSRLTVQDQIGTYRGRSFRYPSRLNDVVRGAREGILNYFKNLPF